MHYEFNLVNDVLHDKRTTVTLAGFQPSGASIFDDSAESPAITGAAMLVSLFEIGPLRLHPWPISS
jgi:hypothetical protein